MADIYKPGKRSTIMAAVKRKDTAPELAVRHVAHSLGYRFRLHRRDLPGKPDVVFSRHRKLIFVHGCFWHRHSGCRHASMPATRTEFWTNKFNRNVERDAASTKALKEAGWTCLVVWECETRHRDTLEARLIDFLHR